MVSVGDFHQLEWVHKTDLLHLISSSDLVVTHLHPFVLVEQLLFFEFFLPIATRNEPGFADILACLQVCTAVKPLPNDPQPTHSGFHTRH